MSDFGTYRSDAGNTQDKARFPPADAECSADITALGGPALAAVEGALLAG